MSQVNTLVLDFSAVEDSDGNSRLVEHVDWHARDLSHDLHALDNLSEYDVLSVKVRARLERDKELSRVRVLSMVCHREKSRARVPPFEIFIVELLAVDGFTLKL